MRATRSAQIRTATSLVSSGSSATGRSSATSSVNGSVVDLGDRAPGEGHREGLRPQPAALAVRAGRVLARTAAPARASARSWSRPGRA